MTKATRRMVGPAVLGAVCRTLLPRNCCIVFMMHRVTPITETMLDASLAISPAQMQSTIASLTRLMPVADLHKWISEPPRGRWCALTFDDGWRDNFFEALPILARNSWPATVFVPTAFVGTTRRFWFERVEALVTSAGASRCGAHFASSVGAPTEASAKGVYRHIAEALKFRPLREIDALLDAAGIALGCADASREPSVLSVDQMRAMSEQGVSFGSHGVNHAIFTALAPEQKRAEVVDSKQMLDALSGVRTVPLLSFPNGTYDQECLNLALDAGYQAVLTASIRTNGSGKGLPLIYRIGLAERTDLLTVAIRLVQSRRSARILTPSAVRRSA